VYVNPLGDFDYYAWKKSGYAKNWRAIYIPASSGYTIVHIKKVFKGQLKYRTTHHYDDTWFIRCKWWRGDGVGPYGCVIVKTPREAWYDDARYDGVSADGKRATFEHGPVNSPGKDHGDYSASWVNDEWRKLPKGVQVK
jgi:hypothetical protein